MIRPSAWHVAVRWLHAVMAILLPVQWCLGWLGERAGDRATEDALFSLHFQLGIWLLVLVVLRLSVRSATRDPEPMPGPTWRRRSAALVQGLMYALLFLLPISGYVIWVWMDAPRTIWPGFDVPALFLPPADDETGRAIAWYVHVSGAWILAGLVAGHAGVALGHEWAHREKRMMHRMWPRFRDTGARTPVR